MEGEATFIERDDGLLKYRETGFATLTHCNHTFAFSRSYVYVVDGPSLRIFFDEPAPRLFHHITLSKDADGWQGSGVHLCAADSYSSDYAFAHNHAFRIRHAVSGPRKSYVIETHFVRDYPDPARPPAC